MSSSAKKPPTLRTIAEITGLSLSTVSLSLRDGSRLRKETREKVARAAAEIGYVPNRAGVRLRTGQTNVLTLILAPQRHNVDYTRILIGGIGAHIADTRYHLNVIPEMDPDAPMDAVQYVMRNRTSDGIILTHTSAHDPRVEMLMEAGFPFVCHGRTAYSAPHAFADFHVERFVALAVARMLSRGRRRFLLVSRDTDTMNFQNTVAAFHKAMDDAGLTGDVFTDHDCLSATIRTRDHARRLPRGAEMPDAIICDNEMNALSMVGGLSDCGLTLGDGFDLICKETTDILPAVYPRMDTLAEDLFATGQELARLMVAGLDGVPAASCQTLLDPLPHWRA